MKPQMQKHIFKGSPRHLRPRGFSLVTAIFLLVVLTALGAAIARIASVQHATSALDVQGVRAYQAARAGIEWGLYQQSKGSCAPVASLNLPGTMSEFTVTVTCATTSGPAAAANLDRWVITATACNDPIPGSLTSPQICPNPNGGQHYMQRVLQARL